MKKDVIEKLATLITAAFGLVAALAWNDAIKALFKGPCGEESAGALCGLSSGGPWAYALIVTVLAVIATVWSGIGVFALIIILAVVAYWMYNRN
jgi:hypothetical protein|tara:strand:+ start:16612 stop:16893 length:282 start_codon:yes stop_codon:yes gene_type:complete